MKTVYLTKQFAEVLHSSKTAIQGQICNVRKELTERGKEDTVNLLCEASIQDLEANIRYIDYLLEGAE